MLSSREGSVDDPVDPNSNPAVPVKVACADVVAASDALGSSLVVTPITRAHLSDELDIEIFYKREYLQFTGSFKERGARYTLLKLSEEQQKAGVVSASMGNHGHSLSYHGQLLGIPVTVVMPVKAPIMKIQGCKKYNAEVLLEGADLSESKKIALRMAMDQGKTYINGYDHPDVIAGQGTLALEILQQMPDLDAVVVPTGGGGLLAGIVAYIKEAAPNVKVVGVESEKCTSMSDALAAGRPTQAMLSTTLADGLAVSCVGHNAFQTVNGQLDKMVVVNEDWISLAILRLVEQEKGVVEGAGAVGLAAILSGQLNDLKGKKVVVILTGGNIDTDTLSKCLQHGLAMDGRLLRFSVPIEDTTSALSELVAFVNEQEAHILEIGHQRSWWAKIVVTLERAVNSDDAHKYLQEYSIRLGPGDDGTAATEQRGVMVIKSKSKTRAKQRKGAVMNWKRVGKVTIKELHKRNMTGEQLRRLMWERASISTPVRVTSPDLLDGDMNTGFGGLAAALDVMAFTNDISLPTSTAGPTVPNGGIAPTAPAAPVPNGGPQTMGWQAPTDAGGKPAAPAPMGWQKPADSGQAGALFSSLSSSLAGTDPPPAYPPPQPPPPRYDALDPDAFRQLVLAADALEPGALVDLARRAALVDELTLVSPRKQHEYCCRGMVETRQNQLSVDQSESDSLGDGPVLGKGSRLRRARSARQRNVASAPTVPPLDQYARYHQDHNNNQRSSSSENDETISVTVATLKTQLLPNGNVKANGHAGRRLESATMNREIAPKAASKPRPKTARNRVAPQEGGQTRRVISAAPTPTPTPAPDPLDAWSTKDIANINSLLDDGEDSM